VALFFARGGWWVIGQFVLFAAIGTALAATGGDPPGWLTVVGAGLALGGAALGVSAGWQIRRHITALPAPREGAPLTEGGAFGLVRHPIYGGAVLGSSGLAALDGNLAALVGSLVLLSVFVGKTRLEERLLIEQHPHYADYRRRVPRRLLPWLL